MSFPHHFCKEQTKGKIQTTSKWPRERAINSGRYANCPKLNDKSLVHLVTKKTEKGRVMRTICATVIGVFLTMTPGYAAPPGEGIEL